MTFGRHNRSLPLDFSDFICLFISKNENGDAQVFWLDEKRAHDREIMAKVRKYLPEHDTSGLDIQIMDPSAAQKFSLAMVRERLPGLPIRAPPRASRICS